MKFSVVTPTWIVAILICLAAYLLPLGARPLIIPDESRYAEIPREMIASGDWVVPRLNGLRYFEKPALGYWVTAASMKLFGRNALALRLPSALATLLTALLLMVPARRFMAGLAAFFPELIFLSFFEVYAIGTFGVLDSLLVFFITGCMVSFYLGCSEKASGWKQAGWMTLAGVFCGLGLLTKGFVAAADPAVAIVPFLTWQRQWKAVARTLWIPLVTAVLVVLPWGLLIHAREPDFWRFFIWNEHIRRFLADNAQHREPIWYFLLLFPAAAMHWSVLLPAVLLGLKKAGFQHPWIRFAVCWLVFPFLFFSFSKGKLLTYILPCFPPLALLTAAGLREYFSSDKTRAFSTGAKTLALGMGLTAVCLALLQWFGYNGFRLYSQSWQWLLVAIGLVVFAAILMASAWAAGHPRKMLLFALAPIPLFFFSHFAIPDVTLALKAPGDFLLRHAAEVTPQTLVVSDEEHVRAVCWYLKRNDVYVLNGAGELWYGLGHKGARYRLLDTGRLRKLIKKHRGNVVYVASEKEYRKLAPQLPRPRSVQVNIEKGFTFEPEERLVFVRY